ncbi:unnamed protein product [Lymnaea stagnalis]|uniref:Beclin 1-associated autophagy-related key regulator n=1 Tax=Lymnaea stagnalis TaxID=6523 RepID=A0AAV2IKV4_LYMST
MAASVSQTRYERKIRLQQAIKEGKIVKVAFEKCPLCFENRGYLLCDTCINGGEFTHTQRIDGPSFRQKEAKWNEAKRERDQLCRRFELEIEDIERANAKRTEIELIKRKITLLKKAITETKAKCNSDSLELKQNKRKRRDSQNRLYHSQTVCLKGLSARVKALSELPSQRLPSLRDLCEVDFNKDCDVKQLIQLASRTLHGQQQEVKESKEGTNVYHKSVPVLMTELDLYHQYLAYRRSHFLETLQHRIFPIEEVFALGDSDNLEMSMATALKDACETAFIGGRWVHGDHRGENHCTIVGSTLADYSGSLSAISLFVMSSRHASENPEKIPVGNPSYGVHSALMYTTMFVTLASHVLDVHLPRLCSLKEIKDDLSEQDFCNYVWRLHQNILHLAYSQNVDPDMLLDNLSLHNVLAILRCPTLGRNNAFVPSYNLPVEVDLCPLEYESEGDVDPAAADMDLTRDWERVPTSLPTFDASSMGLSSPADNNTSTAGALYNAANKAVGSLTGWFTSYYGKK